MYTVIKYFTDLNDGNHEYRAGDSYPRPGFKASKKRINELSSYKNKRGIPLIEEKPSLASENVNTGERTPTPTKAKGTARKGKKKDVGAGS